MITLNQNTRVSFEDITHSYLLDNEIYLMGVTSLMKKHSLTPNYEGIPADVLQKAAERGSKVHKDIEDYCNGVAVPITKELKAYIGLGVNAIANEYLVSDNQIVASSIDIVADAGNGAVDLIDIKTTSTLHLDALSWQLSIYAYLFHLANPDVPINKLYGVHIKAGKAKIIEVPCISSEEIMKLLECEADNLPYYYTTPNLSPKQESALYDLQGITEKIALIKVTLKEAEELKKSIEQVIIGDMELDGLRTLESGPIKVTYVAASKRETVDKARLQDDMPELYEKYKKVTMVAPSLRVTVKNQ